MQSTSSASPWSSKRPVTRPGWSMCAPWLNGGSWRVSSGRQSASKVRSNDRSSFSHRTGTPDRARGSGAASRRGGSSCEEVGRLGERLVPAPLERGQLPRHGRGVVDHQNAAELDVHVRPGTPDRSSRAACVRAPSRRTRPSRSTTDRRLSGGWNWSSSDGISPQSSGRSVTASSSGRWPRAV